MCRHEILPRMYRFILLHTCFYRLFQVLSIAFVTIEINNFFRRLNEKSTIFKNKRKYRKFTDGRAKVDLKLKSVFRCACLRMENDNFSSIDR